MQPSLTHPSVGRRRPFGVVVLTALQVFRAMEAVAFFALLGDPAARLQEIRSDPRIALLAVFSILTVASAVALWRLDRWGWVMTMLLVGTRLAFEIVSYWQGQYVGLDIGYARMAVDVIAVFYLNQRDVRVAFEGDATADA